MAMKRTLVSSLLIILAGLPLITPSPAQAEDPIDVTGQITDRADAIGPDQARVQKALDRFFDRTGLQLFVVYVHTFGDRTGEQWAAETLKRSGLGQGDVLLVVATKDRAYGYDTDNRTFTSDDLQSVDRTRILPALRNDDFAGAAIAAADGYGDIAEDAGLPWGVIVLGCVVVLGAGAFIVHRSRRRFERSHHVLDEHGNPVDPAAILDLEELEDVANRALVAVDDALLTSNDELRHAEAEHERQQTDGFRFTVDRGRSSMREAFRLRQQLDDSPTMPDQGRRRTLSRIIAICEEVDHSLDAQVEAFDALRDWSNHVPQVLDSLVGRRDDLSARRPTGQAGQLLIAAQEQIERGRKALADDEPKNALVHARAAEEAVAQAAKLLDDPPDARTAVDEYITTHRAAVRAPARTRLSEAGRHLRAGNTAEAERLIDAAQTAAEADVAAWNGRQETRGDRRRSPNIEALVLGGILVKPIGRNGLGGIGSLLGGSTHGGGSGEPYGGSERPGSTRTPGSFGGTRTRGRRGGGGRF
jgi:TLP18.3/Psb32/MOLO-1 phosphatase superfamily protein